VVWSGFGVAEASQQSSAAQASPQPPEPDMQGMMKLHEQMMMGAKGGMMRR
jgi:hypothetical protein